VVPAPLSSSIRSRRVVCSAGTTPKTSAVAPDTTRLKRRACQFSPIGLAGNQIWRNKQDDGPQTGIREHDPGDAAWNREQDALGQQLTHELRPVADEPLADRRVAGAHVYRNVRTDARECAPYPGRQVPCQCGRANHDVREGRGSMICATGTNAIGRKSSRTAKYFVSGLRPTIS
jgi:hypothetical protein